MARPWIRLYTEVPNDPKVQRLSPLLFKFWINCLCLAGANDGILPTSDDLAWSLKLKPLQAAALREELVGAGLFERHGDDFMPHGWEDRQFESDTSRDRQKKYRDRHSKRHGDGKSDVTVTAQEQSRTDTDQKQNRTEVISSRRNENWQKDPEFCRFRDNYLSTGSVSATDTDWPKAYNVWRMMDFDQKQIAVEHVKTCDPAFMKYPQNYLADREYNRAQRPEVLRKSKLDQAFEEAAKL